MRAVCMLAKDWLHTTPSRALTLLSEDDDDFDVMLDYLALDNFESNWRSTSRENKIKFIDLAATLRRRERGDSFDPIAEHEDIFNEARALSYRYHGDPTRPTNDDDDLASGAEKRQQQQQETEKPRVAARFGR